VGSGTGERRFHDAVVDRFQVIRWLSPEVNTSQILMTVLMAVSFTWYRVCSSRRWKVKVVRNGTKDES
jgi:hypothetical protein